MSESAAGAFVLDHLTAAASLGETPFLIKQCPTYPYVLIF